MFCEQCGTKIENGKRFCSSCEEQNTKIIEIPKSDILSINDEILPSKKPITASDVIKKIAFVVISIFSSILFMTLYTTLCIFIFSKSSGKMEVLIPISYIFSLIAGIFTFVLIYKLFQKIRKKVKVK